MKTPLKRIVVIRDPDIKLFIFHKCQMKLVKEEVLNTFCRTHKTILPIYENDDRWMVRDSIRPYIPKIEEDEIAVLFELLIKKPK